MTTQIKGPAQEDLVLIGGSGHRPHGCSLTCSNELKRKAGGMFLQRRTGRDGRWMPASNSTCVLHAEVKMSHS